MVFDTILLKAMIRDLSGVCKAGMGVKLRGSKVRDTGVGDPAMEVMVRSGHPAMVRGSEVGFGWP